MLYRSEKYVSCGDFQFFEWRNNSWSRSLESRHRPKDVAFYQIDLDTRLVRIDNPVGRDGMAGIDLGLGYSVGATCRWRQNLYDQIRNAFDGSLSDDVLVSRGNEQEVWLKYRGRVENQINGRVEEFAEVTVIDMLAKQFEKVCGCALMLRARRWRHGQLSFDNLIAIAVVGQKDVILIRENNLPFRNVHGSRHADLGFVDIFTTGGVLASMNHKPVDIRVGVSVTSI
jgi:hypothetical protein